MLEQPFIEPAGLNPFSCVCLVSLSRVSQVRIPHAIDTTVVVSIARKSEIINAGGWDQRWFLTTLSVPKHTSNVIAGSGVSAPSISRPNDRDWYELLLNFSRIDGKVVVA